MESQEDSEERRWPTPRIGQDWEDSVSPVNSGPGNSGRVGRLCGSGDGRDRSTTRSEPEYAADEEEDLEMSVEQD
ncbi:hypothetical protein Emed_007469 [Eimeria media]